MKSFLLGFVCGAAAVCVAHKLKKEGFFDDFYKEVDQFTGKARQNIKHALDKVQDEVEYAGQRAEVKSKQVSSAINELSNKIAKSKE